MKGAFTRTWRLLTPKQRRHATVLLALMVVGAALETASIGLMIPVIALMVEPDIAARFPVLTVFLERLGHPSQQALIIGAMLGLAATFVCKNVYLGFLAWREAGFVFGLQAAISRQLFATYLHQPYTFHLQHNSARLIHTATGVVASFTQGAVTPLLLCATETITLVSIGGLALLIEPVGVLIVGLVLGGASAGYHRITKARLSRLGAAYQYHESLRLQHLMQGLGGAKEVKLLGREAGFLAQFQVHNVEAARVEQAQRVLKQVPRLWLELLTIGGLATLVITMVSSGNDIASIVPIVGFLAAAAFRLMPSVNRILGAVQTVRYTLPVIDRLHEGLTLAAPGPQAGVATVAGVSAFDIGSGIDVSDVSYTYPGAPAPALDRVTMKISTGESVGLIGPSGSGKSTLVDVLLGLLTPSSGHVLVDGHDIEHRLRGWQNQVGYVPQTIYLTDETLRRNVAFGLPDDQINNAWVTMAITAAQLKEFVDGLPEGLETVVGERGVRLSGGQRQRIGIARALYYDPPVLVLDEATSALDSAAERSVMEAVRGLQGKKTVMIVAHRLTTVAHCHRLYRLEKGRIVAEGPPSEMLAP